jgi:hypothetical protein
MRLEKLKEKESQVVQKDKVSAESHKKEKMSTLGKIDEQQEKGRKEQRRNQSTTKGLIGSYGKRRS